MNTIATCRIFFASASLLGLMGCAAIDGAIHSSLTNLKFQYESLGWIGNNTPVDQIAIFRAARVREVPNERLKKQFRFDDIWLTAVIKVEDMSNPDASAELRAWFYNQLLVKAAPGPYEVTFRCSVGGFTFTHTDLIQARAGYEYMPWCWTNRFAAGEKHAWIKRRIVVEDLPPAANEKDPPPPPA